MRSRRPIISLIVGLFVLSLSGSFALFQVPSAAAAPWEFVCYPSSGSASITGKITKPGGAPLQYVNVDVYNSYGIRAGYGSSSATGDYTLSNLIAGTYFLKVGPHSEGYIGEWYTNAQKASDATPIVLSTAEIKSGVTIELALGAKISGTVTNQTGDPLNNVQISVYDANQRQVDSTYSNASSSYTTRNGLPNGSYFLKFEHHEKVVSYYPNASSFDSAEAIVVSSPTNYTANVQLQDGVTISGQVSDAETTAPLTNMAVSISGSDLSKTAYTSSGAYSLKGVRPGVYQLTVSHVFDPSPYVNQTRTITIPTGVSTYNADFALAKGGSISGKVTDSSGNPIASLSVYISNRDGSYQNYHSTDADGKYSATGLPDGVYRLHFRSYDFIEEFYNNKSSWETATTVEIRAAEAKTGIDAQLAPGGKISGKVSDAETGDPIEGVFVEVLDSSGGRISSAFSQADGTYSSDSNLPSGNYRVRFNPDNRNGSCGYVVAYNHNAASEEEAPVLSVTAPNTLANLNVSLKRGAFVTGSVKDAVSNESLSQGALRIYDQAGEVVDFARISELGTFINPIGLASGSYYIQYAGDQQGYVDTFYPNAASREAASAVVLEAPNLKTGIDFRLQKGSFIKGKALLAGTSSAFQEGYIVISSPTGEEVSWASVNDDGTYTSQLALRSGQYYIAAVPYNESEGELSSLASSSGELARIASFYRTDGKAAPSPQSASLLTLTAPSNIENINISVYYGTFLPIVRR
jgi:protocatechuate 3,4-dioxygenase beta subunit